MLGLRAAVAERLLNGHQQLVSQRFVDDAAKVKSLGAGSNKSGDKMSRERFSAFPQCINRVQIPSLVFRLKPLKARCYQMLRPSTQRRVYESIPALLRVFVSEGQDVGGPAAAITNHHGDRRCVPEVLQDDGDDVRAPLYDESHHGYSLTDAWGGGQEGKMLRKEEPEEEPDQCGG